MLNIINYIHRQESYGGSTLFESIVYAIHLVGESQPAQLFTISYKSSIRHDSTNAMFSAASQGIFSLSFTQFDTCWGEYDVRLLKSACVIFARFSKYRSRHLPRASANSDAPLKVVIDYQR